VAPRHQRPRPDTMGPASDMSAFQLITDSFRNLVANLGTGRDKQSGGEYALSHLTDSQWSTIYRTSWMAKKIVDIPAKDATRKWREWEAESSQIQKIEAEEDRLQLPQKVMLALQQSRLFGGAGIYFSIRGDDALLPLDPSRITRGSLEFVTVFPRGTLIAGDIELDPMSEDYGKPRSYTISGSTSGQVEIHRSRIAIFIGAPILDPQELVGVNQGWGDSVLQAAYEAVRNSDSIAANTGSLVYEAKVDVLQIPDLSSIMADPRQRKLLEDRVILSATLKGNNGMMIIDKEEEYSQKTFNFAGLPDIGGQALQAVSGAADIPLTRFLGQSPGGMNSTGESDLKNYYDAINASQSLIITPAMRNLDDALIRSALGDNPDDVDYQWASLWQMTDEQKSKISKETAETINLLVQSQLFPADALSKAAATLLVEHSILPSFEIDETADPDETMDSLPLMDGAPRTLYVYRRVVNTAEIMAWAKRQGITDLIAANELHVTVTYSKTPVDWLEMGEDWSSDKDGRLRVKPGGPRELGTLGEAKVLTFVSNDLTWRHNSMIERGASSDYESYSAHITLTYGELPEGAEPYQGPIILGPETFEEITE